MGKASNSQRNTRKSKETQCERGGGNRTQTKNINKTMEARAKKSKEKHSPISNLEMAAITFFIIVILQR